MKYQQDFVGSKAEFADFIKKPFQNFLLEDLM